MVSSLDWQQIDKQKDIFTKKLILSKKYLNSDPKYKKYILKLDEMVNWLNKEISKKILEKIKIMKQNKDLSKNISLRNIWKSQ